MAFDIFGTKKISTSVTNVTENIADAYNTSMSKNTIAADSGNTTLNVGAGGSETAGGFAKYMPILALLCFGLALFLILGRKEKPWAGY